MPLARVLAVLLVVGTIGWVWESRSSPALPPQSATVTGPPPPPRNLYDPDPNHIWNRVDRQLRVRTDAAGVMHGEDSVDPLLWRETRYLLTGPSHASTLALLDEFLEIEADGLVKDPVRRALLQRDLWAVFDWSVSRTDDEQKARHALSGRLARVIRRIALTPGQIAALPDTYAAAVLSGRYAVFYDPEQRERPFLPPRMIDDDGPWIAIHGSIPVQQHSDEMSRSEFRVFLRVPRNRAATLAYLRKLWDDGEPFVVDPAGSFGGELRTTMSPRVREMPFGSAVALLRRMMLIDTQGEIRVSPIVESLQLRAFRNPEPCRSSQCGHNDQDFFEYVLNRAGLLAAPALGLRPLSAAHEGFITFSAHGFDDFDRDGRARTRRTLEGCVACHHDPGLASVLTARRLFKPYTFAETGGPSGSPMPEFWKTRRADWGRLVALWQDQPR